MACNCTCVNHKRVLNYFIITLVTRKAQVSMKIKPYDDSDDMKNFLNNYSCFLLSNADKHTVKQLEPITEQEDNMTIWIITGGQAEG